MSPQYENGNRFPEAWCEKNVWQTGILEIPYFRINLRPEGTDGIVSFSSSFPGEIKALEICGKSMIVQKSAFLASEEGVELSMHFQKKLGKGIFGGEGFVMQKLSGNGVALATEIDGSAMEYDLHAGTGTSG